MNVVFVLLASYMGSIFFSECKLELLESQDQRLTYGSKDGVIVMRNSDKKIIYMNRNAQ